MADSNNALAQLSMNRSAINNLNSNYETFATHSSDFQNAIDEVGNYVADKTTKAAFDKITTSMNEENPKITSSLRSVISNIKGVSERLQGVAGESVTMPDASQLKINPMNNTIKESFPSEYIGWKNLAGTQAAQGVINRAFNTIKADIASLQETVAGGVGLDVGNYESILRNSTNKIGETINENQEVINKAITQYIEQHAADYQSVVTNAESSANTGV